MQPCKEEGDNDPDCRVLTEDAASKGYGEESYTCVYFPRRKYNGKPGPYTGFSDGGGQGPIFAHGGKGPQISKFPQNHKGPLSSKTRY